MIDLKHLIELAPYDESTRQQILSKLDSLTETQKEDFKLLSWDMIINQYSDKVSFETQSTILGVTEGKIKPEEANLDEVEDKVFEEMMSKLSSSLTEEQLSEVREKLQAATPQDAPKPN